MLRTYLYIPEETNEEIMVALADLEMSKAELMRDALEEGLRVLKRKRKKNKGVDLLRKIGEIGKKYNFRGPGDLSTNMDDYLWGNKKWVRNGK